MIEAVLLDAHGTLVELEPPAPALRRLLAERFGIELSAAQAERAISAEIAYYRTHLGEGRDPASVDELRGRCAIELRRALAAERLLDHLGAGALTEALLAALVFRPFPDVLPTLEELRARGVRVVVASNWDASLAQTLDRIGIGPLLDGVVTSAQVGTAKPDAAVFARALRVAGARAERCLHVGDSIEEDVVGARAAGVQAVLIARGTGGRDRGPVPPGVRVIGSLDELFGFRELQAG